MGSLGDYSCLYIQTDERAYIHTHIEFIICIHAYIQADRHTGRQTDRQTVRQSDRQKDRKTDRQTDRKMDFLVSMAVVFVLTPSRILQS